MIMYEYIWIYYSNHKNINECINNNTKVLLLLLLFIMYYYYYIDIIIN
jgi:hypothetical protein